MSINNVESRGEKVASSAAPRAQSSVSTTPHSSHHSPSLCAVCAAVMTESVDGRPSLFFSVQLGTL